MTQSTVNTSIEQDVTKKNLPTKFHLAINVADLTKSIDFFSIVFDCGPAKSRSDYAKFELENPPVVLSLEPVAPESSGALNHLGFRVPDSGQLVEMQRRLEANGIETNREDGVECCYARQTKFWFHDPDGNLWEVYTLDEDLDHHGHGESTNCQTSTSETPSTCGTSGKETPLATLQTLPKANSSPPRALSLWSHRMGQPLPNQLYMLDGTVDEAHLQGSFNHRCSTSERSNLFHEIFRVLKPGGKLHVHVLTADREVLSDTLNLPGPAASIDFVPATSSVVKEMEATGFQAVQLSRYHRKPCFTRDGISMRETIIEAWKPLSLESRQNLIEVVYKGPFQEIALDNRHTFRRGEFVLVDQATLQLIERAAQDAFTIVSVEEAAPDCGSLH
ncbi:Hypothetical protein PBC10988_9080 [Planctomycetales bacterium 10988]|nr:Hypothetical protein PBC10988_9080 [Planctomycetales bacterium 10988]